MEPVTARRARGSTLHSQAGTEEGRTFSTDAVRRGTPTGDMRTFRAFLSSDKAVFEPTGFVFPFLSTYTTCTFSTLISGSTSSAP